MSRIAAGGLRRGGGGVNQKIISQTPGETEFRARPNYADEKLNFNLNLQVDILDLDLLANFLVIFDQNPI